MSRCKWILSIVTLLILIDSVFAQDPPIHERIEWSDIWVTNADREDLPRVLLVGDSITRGYFRAVEKHLRGQANCARYTTSKFLSHPDFLTELGLLLKRYSFGLIHINNGLHGWGYTEAQYRQAFPALLNSIREHVPGVKIIWATTTPVRDKTDLTRFGKRNDRVIKRNAIARDIMQQRGIPMSELYRCVQAHSAFHAKDGVHFNNQGNTKLGTYIAEVIGKHLMSETKWKSLFDGKTLDGWQGDPKLWSVKDGVIVGVTSDTDPIPSNTFLIWKGKPVRNFELTMKLRMTGKNNSGIQYRSREITSAGDYIVGGYQMDIHSNPPFTGMLYEERGRGIVAKRPNKVIVDPDGKKRVVETLGEATPLNLDRWNEYTIIAQGNRLVHKINGVVTADITDQQQEKAADSGIIALQLHRGPAMQVRVKDIRLKRLP